MTRDRVSSEIFEVRDLDLARPDLDLGDVVQNADSGRFGSVIEVCQIGDGRLEYRVAVGPSCDALGQPTIDDCRHVEDEDGVVLWRSERVLRVRRKDPHRRYLAMCAAEDDPGLKIRRAARARSEFLPEAAWQRAYWRLCNLRQIAPGGVGFTHRDLGRGHWVAAANDCLDRRDRSRHGSGRERTRAALVERAHRVHDSDSGKISLIGPTYMTVSEIASRELGRKTDGRGDPIDPNGRYYVQDARYGSDVGNCASWWRPNRSGYTCDLARAGAYLGSEVARMRATDVPWPVTYVRPRVVEHVRSDDVALDRSNYRPGRR